MTHCANRSVRRSRCSSRSGGSSCGCRSISAHPYWIDAPDLDIDYHVQRVAVPAPGGPREFAEVISRIASVGLERDRPLWQVWFVEGLADGQFAYVTKVHHALADGMSSERLLAEAFTDRRDHTPMGAASPSKPNRFPGGGGSSGSGLPTWRGCSPRLPGLLLRTVRSARRSRAHARSRSDSGTKPFAGRTHALRRPAHAASVVRL